MTEEIGRSLNHFAGYGFRHSFWQLPTEERGGLLGEVQSGLEEIAEAVSTYSLFPSVPTADFLLWTAVPHDSDAATAEFFQGYARALQPLRPHLKPAFTLWGYTAPSTYSRARSAQEIDSFEGDRQTYLVIYPFVKTADWYLLSRDARQGMMNEHIRLGKQYPQIKQLLLYSFGVQDQEFVVVYETEDLPLFSKLVQELRATDARPYTERDTPLYTAVYQGLEAPFQLWSGS